MSKFPDLSYLQPIGVSHMRRVNRSVILEIIRQYSPISRSDISRELGLSMPTVMRIVDELLKEDLVREIGEEKSATGRPRAMLEYNKDGYVVIGVDLGGTNMYGALANIGGEIIAEEYKAQHDSTGEASYSLLTELIQSLYNKSENENRQLLGIAVGVTGVTHFKSGIVEWAPALAWRDFPLKSRLEEQFNKPIVVENDVNLAALGEQWFGAGKGVRDMVLINIGIGMGAGLIVDGAIYRGHTEAAGEVGFLVPDINVLGKRYDHFGALESIISGTGIATRARAMLTGKYLNKNIEDMTSEDVFDAAREGKEWAIEVVNETADYLAMAIANISTLLDPELVVLGGGVANSADILIPRIYKQIEGLIQRIPRIEASTLGARATVMGTITLTVHTTKDYYVLRRLY